MRYSGFVPRNGEGLTGELAVPERVTPWPRRAPEPLSCRPRVGQGKMTADCAGAAVDRPTGYSPSRPFAEVATDGFREAEFSRPHWNLLPSAFPAGDIQARRHVPDNAIRKDFASHTFDFVQYGRAVGAGRHIRVSGV